MKLRIRHIRYALILSILVSSLFGLTRADSVEAHGKELTLTVSSLIPDHSEPLRRMYRVRVAYSGDQDMVEGAEVVLTGTRREGGELLATQRLIELPGEPGIYVAEVVYDRFGEWELEIEVQAALGQGDGAANLVESVTPVVLSAADKTSLLTEADRVQRLQVFFAFEWWPDIATIAIRILHSMSGVIYAGVVGVVLLAAWIGGTGSRILTGRFGENFLLLTTLGLTGILLSGLYGAAFDAPNAAPGIYDYRDLLALPYGDAYFIAFILKPIGWVAMVIFALRIDAVVVKPAFDALDEPDIVAVGVPSGAADDTAQHGDVGASPSTDIQLKRLIGVGTALAAIAVADLAIVIYLHYLSHLGVFLPET
ncbi:MAG: hypothetical protein HQ477_04950 [Chloroflexi bacterium]|nr:hypothetical protein [Chloroflexota bacterium]